MNAEPLPPQGEPALRDLLEKARNFAQEQPAKAMAAGLAAGILMNLLPSRLFSGAVRLAAPLVRPALLTLGVVKACELCCRDRRGTDTGG